jgi:3-oxoacyl-[acyl-carrier protein] reductase
MDLGLKNRAAMVCGASAGLGYAVAEGLATEGARCAVASRDESRIKSAAEKIRAKTGAEVLAVAADLSKPDGAARFVRATLEKFGRIDVLFTNTGGPPPGFFGDFDDAAWQAAYESQLLYIVRMLRLVIPEMKKSGGGRIINNTSISVKEPIDNLLLSNVFRSGVVALSKTLSRELAKDNILINCVAPGYTYTDRVVNLFNAKSKSTGRPFKEIEKDMANSISLGRIPKPEEFAAMVVFLAGDKSSAITGTLLTIDGGYTKGIF